MDSDTFKFSRLERSGGSGSFDRPANRVDVTFDGSLVSAGKHLWVRVNHFKQKGVFSLATIMPFHTNLKLVWSDCRWRQGKVTVRGKPVGTCSPATGGPVDRLSLLRLRFFPEFQRFETGPTRTRHQQLPLDRFHRTHVHPIQAEVAQ